MIKIYSIDKSLRGSRKMIDPVVGSAIVSGLGSLLGGFLSGKSQEDTNAINLQIAREQNKFNLEQWEREQQFVEDMWDRNNRYNDPSVQMRRLVDAGLSPVAAASVLGAGDSQMVSAPSGSPAAGATMQAKNYDYMGQAAQSAVAAYQAEQKNQAEVNLLNEQARGAAADANQKELFNANFADQMFTQQLLQLVHGNKKTWYEAEHAMKDVLRYDSRFDMQNRAAEASIGLMQVQTIQGQLDALLKDAELSWIPEKQKADLALLAAQAYAAKASGHASLSQKDLNELMQNNMPYLSKEQRDSVGKLMLGKQGAEFLDTINRATRSSAENDLDFGSPMGYILYGLKHYFNPFRGLFNFKGH